MIYEIATNDISTALASGASLIIISKDSSSALMRSEASMECISSYSDDELSSLMKEAKWRQPCKDCEV
jgi:hypothetical protein